MGPRVREDDVTLLHRCLFCDSHMPEDHGVEGRCPQLETVTIMKIRKDDAGLIVGSAAALTCSSPALARTLFAASA